jgi:hypothetical protein
MCNILETIIYNHCKLVGEQTVFASDDEVANVSPQPPFLGSEYGVIHTDSVLIHEQADCMGAFYILAILVTAGTWIDKG